jgi:hypothetical protein
MVGCKDKGKCMGGGEGGKKEEEVTTPASMRRGRENLKKKMAAKPKQTVGQMMDLDTD